MPLIGRPLVRLLIAGIVISPSCDLGADEAMAVLVVTETDTLFPRPGASSFVDPTIVLSDSAGTLFVADIGSATIHVIARTGESLREIGRRGSGPGEILFPGPIAVNHDTLLVVDAPNGRVNFFRTTDGAFIMSRRLPVAAQGIRRYLAPDGRMLISTEGADGWLALRTGLEEGVARGIGRAVVMNPPAWDFESIRREIKRGRVPSQLRNMVLPALDPDGSAWLAVETEGSVLYFDGLDSLRWTFRLDPRTQEDIYREFVRRNQVERSPTRIHSLSSFEAAQIYNRELWLLLRSGPEASTELLILNPATQRARRIRFDQVRGVSSFAFDPPRSKVYLLSREGGTILVASLEQLKASNGPQ